MSELRDYLWENAQVIYNFEPTRIILHIGFCDLTPRSRSEESMRVAQLLVDIGHAATTLTSMCPGKCPTCRLVLP